MSVEKFLSCLLSNRSNQENFGVCSGWLLTGCQGSGPVLAALHAQRMCSQHVSLAIYIRRSFDKLGSTSFALPRLHFRPGQTNPPCLQVNFISLRTGEPLSLVLHRAWGLGTGKALSKSCDGKGRAKLTKLAVPQAAG
jgi:hypothetical protein